MCVHKVQGCVEEAEIDLKCEEKVDVDLWSLESDREESNKISKFWYLVIRNSDPSLAERGKLGREGREDKPWQ